MDDKSHLVPVILSGGSGTRLWPLSRERLPKQLLPLLGPSSLLQDTLERARRVTAGNALIVCNQNHRFLVAEQARQGGWTPEAVILEPVGRNTAPAIAVAALEARRRFGPDCLMLVMPADHVITDLEAFVHAAGRARAVAASGRAVTFGIHATRPETGFGYIQAGAAIPAADGAREVTAFVEKPDLETAQRFLASGDHYWNSGMFVLPAGLLLDRLAAFEPEMATAALRAWEGAQADADFLRLDPDAFAASPSNSVDYAVMERLEDAAMVPLDAGWDDVGSFTALWQLGSADADGVVAMGDVLAEGSRNCYLRADHRFLATLGVSDLIVVETADAVLVADRGAAQDVRRIVDYLKQNGRTGLVVAPPGEGQN